MLFKRENFNYKLIVYIILLGLIGVATLIILNDVENELVRAQAIGLIVGLMVAVFVSLFDYHFVGKFFIPLFLISLVLLVLVRYSPFGISVRDSRRWLGIEDKFSFQPSELTKVIYIIFFSKYFEIFKDKINKWYVLVLSLVLFGMQAFLVFKQPDLSTTIILAAVYLIILFISGLSKKIIIPVISVTIPATAFGLWYLLRDWVDVLKPYHKKRILSFIYPERYPNLVYQQTNSVKAISGGKLFGKFLTGDTSQRGTLYVPIHDSDFIFSGIGEEFGFFGAVILILLYILVVYEIMKIALYAKDMLGRNIATGVAVLIGFQAFVNIGVATFLLPNTGIPLPFVSYGLSSLFGSFIAIGIVLNIGMQRNLHGEGELL